MFKTIQDEKFTCKIYNPRTLRCPSFPTDKPLKNNNRLPTRQLHSRAVKKKKKKKTSNKPTRNCVENAEIPRFKTRRVIQNYTSGEYMYLAKSVLQPPPLERKQRASEISGMESRQGNEDLLSAGLSARTDLLPRNSCTRVRFNGLLRCGKAGDEIE